MLAIGRSCWGVRVLRKFSFGIGWLTMHQGNRFFSSTWISLSRKLLLVDKILQKIHFRLAGFGVKKQGYCGRIEPEKI